MDFYTRALSVILSWGTLTNQSVLLYCRQAQYGVQTVTSWMVSKNSKQVTARRGNVATLSKVIWQQAYWQLLFKIPFTWNFLRNRVQSSFWTPQLVTKVCEACYFCYFETPSHWQKKKKKKTERKKERKLVCFSLVSPHCIAFLAN